MDSVQGANQSNGVNIDLLQEQWEMLNEQVDQEIQIGGETIENVEKFEHLGSLLTWEDSFPEEIRRTISKATGAMSSMKHVWHTKK